MFFNINFYLIYIVHLCNYFCISSIIFLQDMFQNLFSLCIYGKCSSIKFSNQVCLQFS